MLLVSVLSMICFVLVDLLGMESHVFWGVLFRGEGVGTGGGGLNLLLLSRKELHVFN